MGIDAAANSAGLSAAADARAMLSTTQQSVAGSMAVGYCTWHIWAVLTAHASLVQRHIHACWASAPVLELQQASEFLTAQSGNLNKDSITSAAVSGESKGLRSGS